MTFFVSIILNGTFCFTQFSEKQVDSMISALDYFNFELGHDSVIKRFKEIEQISTDIEYKRGEYVANTCIAHILKDYAIGDCKPYIRKLDSLNQVSWNFLDANTQVDYYLIKGYYAGLYKNDFLSEISFYIKADSIAELREAIAPVKAKINAYMASYYNANEEYDKAINVLKKNLELLNIDDSTHFFVCVSQYVNLGLTYFNIDVFDSCIYYLKKAEKYGFDTLTDYNHAYLTISRAYINLKELDSSFKYINLSKKAIIEDSIYTYQVGYYYATYAKLYSNLKQFDSSLYYSKQAYIIYDSIKFHEGKQMMVYYSLQNELWKLGEKNLVDKLFEYKTLIDLIHHRKTLEIEKNYSIKHETEKKVNRINQLENQAQQDSLKLYILLISIFLLLIIFALLFFRYRGRKQLLEQKLANEELERNHLRSQLDQKISEIKNRNKLIGDLKDKLEGSGYNDELTKAFDQNYISDQQWDNIILQFKKLNSDFIESISRGGIKLTKQELKMAILIKMGYANTSISEILKISPEGVKKAKYRLKKKIVNETVLFS